MSVKTWPLFLKKFIVDFVETATGAVLALLVIPSSIDGLGKLGLAAGTAVVVAAIASARRNAGDFYAWLREQFGLPDGLAMPAIVRKPVKPAKPNPGPKRVSSRKPSQRPKAAPGPDLVGDFFRGVGVVQKAIQSNLPGYSGGQMRRAASGQDNIWKVIKKR